MQTSATLLGQLNAALAAMQRIMPPTAERGSTQTEIEQLLHQTLAEQRLPQLLAQLLMWLQQRPEWLFGAEAGDVVGGAAAAAAAGKQAADASILWQECVACSACIAGVICGLASGSSGSRQALKFAGHLTEAFKLTGEQWPYGHNVLQQTLHGWWIAAGGMRLGLGNFTIKV
jgi:hypothetical protein